MTGQIKSPHPAADAVADLFAAPGIAGTWMRFWFTPTSSQPLAVVRIATAAVGLLLLWSYASDLLAWFGPAGILQADTVADWRGPSGWSLFDFATSPTAVRILFAITAAVFGLLLVGLLTPITAVAAAVLWASLLNRGPMLAGPADDATAPLAGPRVARPHPGKCDGDHARRSSIAAQGRCLVERHGRLVAGGPRRLPCGRSHGALRPLGVSHQCGDTRDHGIRNRLCRGHLVCCHPADSGLRWAACLATHRLGGQRTSVGTGDGGVCDGVVLGTCKQPKWSRRIVTRSSVAAARTPMSPVLSKIW